MGTDGWPPGWKGGVPLSTLSPSKPERNPRSEVRRDVFGWRYAESPSLDHPLSPILLYAGCGLGALAVALSMPRKNFNPYVVGAVLGAAALGLVMFGLWWKHPESLPNLHFYLFSAIALGAALRVITHPRPVYAALYFVLTILASAGLYLILSAEFMTFALIIVYAGAILITYLFVIMLATESPTEEQPDALNEYDRVAREPVTATLAGFVLLAGLSTLFTVDLGKMSARPELMAGDRQLAIMARKVEPILKQAGLLKEGETVKAEPYSRAAWGGAQDGDPTLDAITVTGPGGERRITREQWPADLKLSNSEGVAFSLIDAHPAAIEIAGVILLMAMLGAVVLARKKVEMDERAMAAAMARERSPMKGDELGIEGRFAQPGVGEGGAA